ncbi:hypothetical protein [uncultured Ramlibacter sp.]|uniref:hypothetical protein n=1 Tax=uncultured Ramlibacter sp. TaxID=260755 RepID=UPI00261A73CB|nr:hypothetical protein [uncultured Ramlibacter sp.]
MSSTDPRPSPRPLQPAGQRWGRGAASVCPYLREAWAARPRNPVFTPEQVAAVVWPEASNDPSRKDPFHA